MLHLDFSIINPWYVEDFKSLFMYSKLISKFKVLEFQIYTYSQDILGFKIDWMLRKRDHAGLTLELYLFSLNFCLTISDTRHWDHDKDDWSIDGLDLF